MLNILPVLQAILIRNERIQQELNELVVQLEQEEEGKKRRGVYLAGSYIGTCWKHKPNTWPPEGEGDGY